ncbi:MAG: DNA polymerase domain-containing protein [Candidatus Aenigmatarchaeota archaeon]
MELVFQVIDCDYTQLNNSPLIRLFGKTEDGKTVCAFFENFYPYFYVKVSNEGELVDFLNKKFSSLILKVEKVKKFLPIGYQEEKTDLLKIILKDPAQTPAVRDELKRQKFVEEIFEADILFKYRFMADMGIFGMKWICVEGSPISTTTVKTDKVISAKKVSAVENPLNVPLRHMSLDIEVVSSKEGIPNPTVDPVAMISLAFLPSYSNENTLVLVAKKSPKKEQGVLFFKSEKEMLEKFLEIIDDYDPDAITGYNINNFDMPFILERLKQNKLSRVLGRDKEKIVISRKFGIKTRNSILGRYVIDVYELVKESVGKGLLRLKRYGLGDVSKELIGEDKVDIAHSEISKYWNGDAEMFSKLITYSRKDAELVLKLLIQKDMIEKFIELSKVSGLLLQDVLDGGEANRVENVLLREFNKQDFVVPCKPEGSVMAKRDEERLTKGLKGALVLDPEVGLHMNPVVYLDFTSMYPSIYAAYNICPTTLLKKEINVDSLTTPYGAKFVTPKIREGIIPKIVKQLITDRSEIKKLMKKAKSEKERKILEAKQSAIKYVTNSFYGYTGYVRARFYVLDVASAITSCGREIIQRTKNKVEEDKNYKVIYGDTDSIMVRTHASNLEDAMKLGQEIEQKINKELEGVVQMKIESIFKSILILAKKRYAGLSMEKTENGWEEKIVMKGIETVRRDWCDIVSKTLYDVLEIILKEQDPKKAFKYVKGILSRLEKNDIPLDQLLITKSISKSLGEYKGVQPHIELLKKMKKRNPASAPGIGDRIGYVIVKGLQLMSERAEDPDYVKRNNLHIDSKYYAESQILPPLERVFEAIGIDKTELLGLGRQTLLREMFKTNKRSAESDNLTDYSGLICGKCSMTYRRSPLIGKCLNCGGELMFYSGEAKSRFILS